MSLGESVSQGLDEDEVDLRTVGGVRSRRRQAAARRAQILLDEVLSKSPVGFGLVDSDYRYEMINPVLAKINGHPLDMHFGRSIRELLPGVADFVEPLINRVLETGEPVIGEVIVGETNAQPGVERVWSANYYRVDLGDEQARIALIVDEITGPAQLRRRAERLADLATKCGAAFELPQVESIVADEVAQYLSATVTILALSTPDRPLEVRPGSTTLNRLDGYDAPLRGGPHYEAVRRGETVLVRDRDHRQHSFPETLDLADHLGIEASAALPLEASDGAVFGALYVGWSAAYEDDDFPLPQLQIAAEVIGLTVERVRANRARSDLTAELQSALLRPVPDLVDIDVAVRYIPAVRSLGIGGDWYDVVQLGEHQFALIVGDVVGHNAIAAARMARISTVLATVLRMDDDPATVFERAGRMLDADSTSYATVGIVIVDTARSTLTSFSAGHPLPLIVSGGQVTTLPTAHRAWLGVDAAPVAPAPVTYHAGDLVILYTDGLIEERSVDMAIGVGRLRGHIASIGGSSPEAVADSVLNSFGTQRSDDVALIVARL